MSASIVYFFKLLVVGILTSTLMILIKKLQIWLKFHYFFENICNFCIFLVGGAIAFVINLSYGNGFVNFWGVLAFLLGYVLIKLIADLAIKIANKKSAT